jgi:hypothetical protein
MMPSMSLGEVARTCRTAEAHSSEAAQGRLISEVDPIAQRLPRLAALGDVIARHQPDIRAVQRGLGSKRWRGMGDPSLCADLGEIGS